MGDEEAQPEMETVSVVRAFKAAAAVMGFGCFLLCLVTTGATSWYTVTPDAEPHYNTYGLFQTCKITLTEAEKVDDLGTEVFECDLISPVASWLAACQALHIIADLLMFISFIVLSVGICSASLTKFTLYKVAIVGYLLVVLLLVVILIIFPTMALSPHGADDQYALGWVYVAAWINTALVFICALTVIIDKGEELTEREKVVEEEEEEE